MTGTIVLPTSGPLTAASFAGSANTALAALSNMFQSATAPTTGSTGLASLAGIWWHDTANNLIKVRNQADSAWITVGTLDETNNLFGAAAVRMGTGKLLGRTTASAGMSEEITVGTGLSLSAGTLSATATGGGTSIASGSLSGTSQVFTSIPATYAYLALQVTGMSFTGSGTPTVRFSTNNGSSYDSTASNYAGIRSVAAGNAALVQASALENVLINSSAVETFSITIKPYQGGTYTRWTAVIDDGTSVSVVNGVYKSTSAINALQIAGGTFDAGTYALYGYS